MLLGQKAFGSSLRWTPDDTPQGPRDVFRIPVSPRRCCSGLTLQGHLSAFPTSWVRGGCGGLTWDAEESLTSVGDRRPLPGACPAGLGVDPGLDFPAACCSLLPEGERNLLCVCVSVFCPIQCFYSLPVVAGVGEAAPLHQKKKKKHPPHEGVSEFGIWPLLPCP